MAWLAKAQDLLRAAHLQHLASGALLLLTGAMLSLLADAIHPKCITTCPRMIIFPKILGHASIITVIGSLTFLGAWIAGIAHRTWQERIHLEAMIHGENGELAQIGQGRHTASPILAQARTYLWTGLVTGIPSMLLFVTSLAETTLVPAIFLLSAVASAAAVVRGTVLLREGRLLLDRVRLDAGIHPGAGA